MKMIFAFLLLFAISSVFCSSSKDKLGKHVLETEQHASTQPITFTLEGECPPSNQFFPAAPCLKLKSGATHYFADVHPDEKFNVLKAARYWKNGQHFSMMHYKKSLFLGWFVLND